MNKTLCKIISTICVLSFLINSNIVIAEETSPAEKKYIIITKNIEKTKSLFSENNTQNSIGIDGRESTDIVIANLTEKEVDKIQKEDFITSVEEDISLTADSININNKLTTSKPWNIQMIKADKIEKSSKFDQIKVGIIDSGVNISSEYTIYDDVNFTNEDNYLLYPDMTGHGTSIAGIIASNKEYGINNNVELVSIKVMNSDNKTTLSKVIKSIYWAIDNQLDILNMSFGTDSYSASLEKAINDAYNSGILIIASAGNDKNLKYPAAFENVIAVGSIDNNGDIISQNTDKYDNIIFAPGENIISTGDFGSSTVKSGTSMAAAHISAITSILWQKDKTKSNKFIKELLFNTANTSVFGNKVADLECALNNYEDFENNYIENNNKIISNNARLDTFSDEIVETLWGPIGHEATVENNTNYGDELTIHLKVLSNVPDNKSYTMKYATENYNYLSFSEDDANNITLSDNTTIFNSLDENYNFRDNSILHGRGNYLASVRFLYTVARNLVNNNYTGTRINRINNAILDALDDSDVEDGTFYGENKRYCKPIIHWRENPTDTIYPDIESVTRASQFTSLQQRLSLEKAVYIVANMAFTGQNDAFNELKTKYTNVIDSKSFEIKTAIKIIGLATHLCGDIYAHKTVVPLDTIFSNESAPTPASNRDNETIYRGTTYDFNGSGRWTSTNGIKVIIQGNSTITTQQINQWMINEANSTAGYPDSLYFYKERHSIASTQTIGKMYNNFFYGYDGTTLADRDFYTNWFLHTNYSLKLANLKLYAYSIGSQPKQDDRLTRLSLLDSKVALSDVLTNEEHKVPNDTTNTTWFKGYVPSY